MILRRFLIGAAIAAALLSVTAGRASADAASYIRTLFDATIGGSDPACGSFLPLAHVAAGQHRRHFDAAEGDAFDRGFCRLAVDALNRLRQRYPDLTLTLTGSLPGPMGTFWVRSRVNAGGENWPVDWLVAGDSAAPHVADLKVMGISMAIFLRSLAANVTESQAEAVLAPWRRALKLAFPD